MGYSVGVRCSTITTHACCYLMHACIYLQRYRPVGGRCC